MKKGLLIPAALLGAILAFCLWNGTAMSAHTARWRAQLEEADRLVLLGDILYHGPRNDLPKEYAPKEVLGLLNARKEEILCVRGNCDTEVDQMVLEFSILADYGFLYEQGRMIFLTHGHKFNEEHLPMLKKGDILLHGHTHVPVCREHESYVYMNPGSVSIPKEGSAHSCMIFENGVFLWKDLDGEAYREYIM